MTATTAQGKQLAAMAGRVARLLANHIPDCAFCGFDRKPTCPQGRAFAEAMTELGVVVEEIEHAEPGTLVRYHGSVAEQRGGGWVVDGACNCNDDYACPADVYQLTHKDGAVLTHVHRASFTAV